MNKVLTDYYEVRKLHDKALGELEEKTQRIVTLLQKIFKCPKDTWWSFKYYESGDDDSPLPEKLYIDPKYGDSFPIHISKKCDSGKWYYNEAIPVKFFDMTDEEITLYIKNEICETEAKVAAEAEIEMKRQEAKNAKRNALKAKAVSKLTQAEKKALGL